MVSAVNRQFGQSNTRQYYFQIQFDSLVDNIAVTSFIPRSRHIYVSRHPGRACCLEHVHVLVYLYTHFTVKIKSSVLFCSVLSRCA